MPPKFGTSGLRGLVSELTPDLVADHVRAYLASCAHGGAVHVGWDLRPSSPEIAEVVIDSLAHSGIRALRAGALPTPALALAAMQQGHGAIMITGSHIPADRNGLKFYTPDGEITKADEALITAALGQAPAKPAYVAPTGTPEARAQYIRRYADAFGADALAGRRIGVYQHSSVARDILPEILHSLGATPIPLARSDVFIPVDTEAVDPGTGDQLASWCADQQLDALVSTDGDADRPMVCDANGRILPGDILGVLSARMLGADVIVTPVSSNSMIADMPEFTRVDLTRIGSPYVIANIETIQAENAHARVVGFEANGGFLLGFTAQAPHGPLPPLMTRDSVLPILAPLILAQRRGQSLGDLVDSLPPRFTAADRITGVESAISQRLITALAQDAGARARFFDGLGKETALDLTDGLRVRFTGGQVMHLRPSGNAPECRCYTEADSPAAARALLADGLARLRAALTG